MSTVLVDSHCHLDLKQFDEDRDQVLARASAAGVQLIINPGIDLAHSRRAIELAELHPAVYAAVGVHPTSSGDFDDERTIAQLRELASHPKVVAIGEIGLDYHWKTVAPAQQQSAFVAQLELAAEVGLPVIIHSRESNDDVANTLRAWATSEAVKQSPLGARPFWGVLHAFSGDLALAQEAYDWHFLLSLGGPVTFKNARALQALVPQLRQDALMLETDAPYLTPHPFRGKRNEPANVVLPCEKIAELCSTTPAAIAEITTRTALRFFGLEDYHLAGHAFLGQGQYAPTN